MKRRLAFTSVLVIAAILIAAMPAAANDDGLGWETWSEDASCDALYGVVGVALWDEEGEPAEGVPVTFTWHGSDFGPYYTDDDGVIYTFWAYTPGEGEVTVGISAEGWGYTVATFSGPDECEGAPTPFVEVSWPCGQETPTATLGWTGEIDGVFAYISAEGDEQWEESEGNSVTFEVTPGATYYYYLEWWIEEDGWGFTEGYFTVSDECSSPPAPEQGNWIPRYRMVAVIDYGAPPEYWGQGARNGSCWVKMPVAEGAPWVGRVAEICDHPGLPADFVYSYDRILYDAWVEWNPVTGEVRYADPLWDSAWFDPDYRTLGPDGVDIGAEPPGAGGY